MAETDSSLSGIEGDHSFRTIVHQAREFILKLGRDGRILFVNQYAVEVSGRSAATWIGRSFESVIHPDDLPLVRRRMEVVKKGEPVTVELRIFDRTKNIIWLHTEALPIFQSNTLKYILCFARDITQQKRIETALRNSEEQYKKTNILLEGTFNAIPDILGIQDPNHTIIRYNAAGYKFLNLTPEQANGRKCYELIGLDAPCDVCATTLCSETKSPERVEKYMPDMNIWLDVRSYPILDDSGNIEYIIEHLRDITEGKLTEKKLYLFKHAVEGSTDAIGMATIEGKHWYQNRTYDDIFGTIAENPIIGAYLDDTDGKHVFEMIKSGEEFTGEITMKNKDGQAVDMLTRAYPIKDHNESIIGFVGVHTDISKQKEAERCLRESEMLYRNIFETSLAGLWRTRKSDGKFLRANETTARYLGFASAQDLIDKCSAADLYQNPDDRNDLLSALDRDGVVTDFPLQFRLPDGTHKDFLISARDFPDHGCIEGVIFDITAQKKAEKALAALEEDLRTTLNSIGDAVIATDTKGIVVRLNPVAEILTGYSGEQARGRPLRDIYRILNARSGKPVNNFVEQIMAKGHIVSESENTVLVTREDVRRRVSVSGTQIKNFDGNITGTVLVFRDVTEEYRIRETLRQSEERFRSLAELLPVGLFESDLNVRLKFVNSTALRMFGYTSDDLRGGLNGLDMFSPASRKSAKKNLARRLQGEEIQVVEYIGQRKNGQTFPVLFYINTVLDPNGKPTGLRGVMIDISDRKRTEEELRESEEFSSSLLENSPHAIVVMNPDMSLKFVNPAFEKLSGFTAAEVTGQTPPYSWWPEDRHTEIHRNHEKLLHGDSKVCEELFQKKNGEMFWVEMSASRSQREDGELKYFICSWIETTERKEMESRLRKMSLQDPLTDLYNRAFFEEEMRRLREDRNRPMSVVVCDIDGLKLINETMGHHMGDALLQAAADILRSSFRKSDIIARVGGDEFAVILPGTSALVTQTCCERIRNQVRAFNAVGNKFHLSISVGYAASDEVQTELDELFKIADHNMYREKLQQSHSSRSDIVQALIKTMEARDYITEGHAERMQDMAHAFGKRLGFPDVRLNDLKLLCRFHDLGKVGVSDQILFKPSQLTASEFRKIKTHCEIGYRIALSIPDLSPIADFILKHHEWWNGQGYPLGLIGEEIPVESRILSIVDAYDAMTNDRPYKKAMTREDAIREMEHCAGEQFDPILVRQFVEMLRELNSGS